MTVLHDGGFFLFLGRSEGVKGGFSDSRRGVDSGAAKGKRRVRGERLSRETTE